MVYLYIFVMAFVTYLLRAVPLTVFRKKIENRFLCSFLYYVPYACLTALTIPAIFSATEYAGYKAYAQDGRKQEAGRIP